MNVLTNLVKRNLILNKRRTIVTIISIILSCALIGGVATLIGSFQKFMQDVEIEGYGNYHAIYKDVPVDKEKYIAKNAYIEKSMNMANIGYAKLNGSVNEYKPYLFIEAFDESSFKYRPLKLIEGRLPKNSNEIVISSQIEADGGIKYNVGETLTLDIGKRYLDGEILDQEDSYVRYESDGDHVVPIVNTTEQLVVTSTRQYKIVGTAERPTIEPYNAPGYTVITLLDSKLLSSIDKIDISIITKNPRGIYEKLETIAKEAGLPQKVSGEEKYYDIEYHNALLRWYGVTNNDNANSILYGFATILIIVIMIASIIVIYNSFNISITERKKQFGMLSSIGTTSKQIRNMVLKEGLILSLIGIPLGIISSIIGIGITLSVVNGLGIFEEFYQTGFTLTVSSLSILVTIFFGGLTIFLSILIPALKASRTSPIDSIRLSNDIKIKGKKLRTPKFIRKLFGIEGELGLKNMKRNRKKYRSTIISLFVSIVLFMAVNGFAEYTFRSTLKVYNDYNFNVGITNLNNVSYSDLKKDIEKLDYVDKYTITNTIDSTLLVDEKDLNKLAIADMKQNNYDAIKQKYMINIKLSTLGDEEFTRYVKEIGGNLQDYLDPTYPRIIMIDKSNFYSQTQGKYYQITLTNLKENDEIILNNDNIVNKMRIDKITSTYPIGFNNADGYIQSLQGFISNKVYDSLDNSLKSSNTMVLIQSSNPDKLMDEIKALGKEKGIDINAQNIQEEVQMLNNAVLAISIFLYGFIVLVSLITITNVINTITTSIYLRRREFAMLKAIGMTNKDFNKMIRFESIFYGLKSLLYGLPIGILLDYFMYKNIKNLFIYDYVLPYKPIFICICFDFIIIAITMAYSIRKIRNDNIIDIIKQENL